MRKSLNRLFLGCVVLVVMNARAQISPLSGSLIIKGKINGLTKGSVSVTTEVFAEKKTFDAALSDGKFEIRITQPSPTLYSLLVKEDQTGRLLFFADNGIVQVDANKGDLGNAKVSGSISNKEFNQYNTMVSNYDFLLKTIEQEWGDMEQKAAQQPEQLRATTGGWGVFLPKADSLQKAYKRTTEKKDSSISTWVTQHNKSFVSPLVMTLNYGNDGDPVNMRKMFDGFSADVKMSYYGNHLDAIITRKEGLNIGKAAPLFSQADPDGKPISLESFRGKYVLIDFWASWCGPCRKENPNVVRTYEKFKDNDFEILGVSLDSDKSKWLKAIQDDQLTWAQVSDLKFWKNAVALQYGVQSIPANFLLDKEGKIIAKGLRGPALEQTLERLLR